MGKQNTFESIGTELRYIRNKKQIKLKDMAEAMKISSTYLSEIERRDKAPSEELIKKISEAYNIEEIKLYKGFGKVSEKMLNELISEYGIYDILYDLSNDSELTREEKDLFYQKISLLYSELLIYKRDKKNKCGD